MYLRKPLYFMVIQDQMMIFSEKYIGKIKIQFSSLFRVEMRLCDRKLHISWEVALSKRKSLRFDK